MNILNSLKTALLVTSIMLLPTIGYAMDEEQNQGEHAGPNLQASNDKEQEAPKEAFIKKSWKKEKAEEDTSEEDTLPYPIYDSSGYN